MKSNKHTYTVSTIKSNNLIGEQEHKHFIELQALYGIAQRGGVKFPFSNETHTKRLVNNVNILSSQENKQLIFSEVIFSN